MIYICKYCKSKSDVWLAYNKCCATSVGIHYDAYGIKPVYRKKQLYQGSNIEDIKENKTTWISIDDMFNKFLSDEIIPLQDNPEKYTKKPHGLAEGSINLIHGEAGSGKTALIIYWLGLIAKSGYNVIYNTTEVPISKIKGRLMSKMPDSFSGWDGWEVQDYYNMTTKLSNRKKPYLLAIDSINDLQLNTKATSQIGLLKAKMDHIVEFAHHERITLLVAMHETKDNKIKGDSDILHNADNIFKITKIKGMSMIRCEKGRDYDRDAEMKIILISGKGMREYYE